MFLFASEKIFELSSFAEKVSWILHSTINIEPISSLTLRNKRYILKVTVSKIAGLSKTTIL